MFLKIKSAWLIKAERRIYASVDSSIINSISANGLSPVPRQAIIWTNAGILSIEPLGTNFCESLDRVQQFPFEKTNLKLSSAKRRSFCLPMC